MLVVGWAPSGAGSAEDAPPSAVADGTEAAVDDAMPEDAAALLREAFARRYGRDLAARLRLTLRGRDGGVRVREIETVTSHEGGRMRALGRVLAPESLRGMTVLALEAEDRADDTFLFLPSLGRVRRVAASRRGDAFLGSDLTWDDLERLRPQDYRPLAVAAGEVAGEAALRVVTQPAEGALGRRVEFWLAASDLAILGVRHLGRDGTLRREIEIPREGIRAFDASRIPTRVEARTPARGTSTSVEVLALEVDPVLDPRLFSVVTLEAGRALRPEAGRERPTTDPQDAPGRVAPSPAVSSAR